MLGEMFGNFNGLKPGIIRIFQGISFFGARW
jgi:hypothetical protein